MHYHHCDYLDHWFELEWPELERVATGAPSGDESEDS